MFSLNKFFMQAEASDLKLSQGMGAWDRGPESLLFTDTKELFRIFYFWLVVFVIFKLITCYRS